MVDHVDAFDALCDRFVAALRAGPPALAVDGCPGWSLDDLGRHLGGVHRWVIAAIRTGAPPDPASLRTAPDEVGDLAEWVRDGADELAAELRSRSPLAPTWHPFAGERVIAVWSRRQAHEALVHTTDAEAASFGSVGPIDPLLAADGIAEYFEVIVPRLVGRDGRATPVGALVVDAIDIGERWLVTASGREPTLSRLDGTADASLPRLAAPVVELLLALWGRRDLRIGDGVHDPVASAWLAFGGN